MVTQMEILGQRQMVVGSYWAFLALLVLNCLYPPTLFLTCVRHSPTLRASACLLDASLGLGYMITYLVTILIVLPTLRWESLEWDNTRQAWDPIRRQISPIIAFPNDPFGYIAISWPVMRTCALCRALESISLCARCVEMPTVFNNRGKRHVARWLLVSGYTLAMLGFVVRPLDLRGH